MRQEGRRSRRRTAAISQSGAFTGEVSRADAADVRRRRYVIVGHSERRNVYRENDALIATQARAGDRDGLTPVLCIGEDQNARDARRASSVPRRTRSSRRVGGARDGGARSSSPTSRSGRSARDATPRGAMVRGNGRGDPRRARAILAAALPTAPVLYGGSVTPENIDDLVDERRRSTAFWWAVRASIRGSFSRSTPAPVSALTR